MGEISDRVKQVLKPLVDRGFLTENNLKYLVLIPKPHLGRFYLGLILSHINGPIK